MFKNKVNLLIEYYGVKRRYIINLISSNRVTFAKKLKEDTFTENEKILIIQKYGELIKYEELIK